MRIDIDISKARVLAHGDGAITLEAMAGFRGGRLLMLRMVRRRITESADRLDFGDGLSWRQFPHRWWVRCDDMRGTLELHLFVFTYLGRIDPTRKAAFRVWRAWEQAG